MSKKQPPSACLSFRGDRSQNQDRAVVLHGKQSCLLVLGDGLSGHPRGEMAAQILVDTCQEQWDAVNKPVINPIYFLQKCSRLAHEAISDFGLHQKPPIVPRTTAVLALLQEGHCYWGHAGDSRFYLIRDGGVAHVSRDHIVANESISTTMRAGVDPNAITRCLGGHNQGAAMSLGNPLPVREGDVILLCSDGFWHQLDEQRIVETLTQGAPLEEALEILCNHALVNAMGESDNITVAAVEVRGNICGIKEDQLWQDEETSLLAAIDHLNRLIDEKL